MALEQCPNGNCHSAFLYGSTLFCRNQGASLNDFRISNFPISDRCDSDSHSALTAHTAFTTEGSKLQDCSAHSVDDFKISDLSIA